MSRSLVMYCTSDRTQWYTGESMGTKRVSMSVDALGILRKGLIIYIKRHALNKYHIPKKGSILSTNYYGDVDVEVGREKTF
jgi:exosome complex RNA-binding protein Rrp4